MNLEISELNLIIKNAKNKVKHKKCLTLNLYKQKQMA